MRILALDQATNLIGWSIWENTDLLEYGIEDFSDSDNPIERISQITKWTTKIIKKKEIDIVGLEDTFLQRGFKGQPVGVDTFKLLNKLLGTIENALHNKKILYHIVRPTEWKSTLGVKGRKREEQKVSTISQVKRKFEIEASEDIADAIGIGWHIVKKILPKIIKGD